MCINSPEKATTNSSKQDDVSKLLESIPRLAEMFHIRSRVGEGTFSTVYVGTLKQGSRCKTEYAIKHIVPTSHPNRILFELKCLKLLGGANNVASISLCLREKNDVVFIMPYHPHEPFSNYVFDMDSEETAHYMYNLLKAINHVHKHGIIHRDIKPSNFLYDRRNRRYLLVDFGLAQLNNPESTNDQKRKRESDSEDDSLRDSKKPAINSSFAPTNQKIHLIKKGRLKENIPRPSNMKTKNSSHKSSCFCYGKPQTCSACVVRKRAYASRAGTPGFRAPEVLLKSKNQTFAIDVWAAGIVLLCILGRCCNFFSSPDDVTALAEMITLFGMEAIEKLAKCCGYHLICSEVWCGMNLRNLCLYLRSRGTLTIPDADLACKKCGHVCLSSSSELKISDEFPSSAYDLLRAMLDVNPDTRITADDALKHAFFSEM